MRTSDPFSDEVSRCWPLRFLEHRIDKLSRDIAETLRMPDVVKRLAPMGYNTPVGGTPADLAALIRKGSDYWRGVIDAVGMTKSR
jgi:tripartite-type tricarboxylate transporter receptor subunit TctC